MSGLQANRTGFDNQKLFSDKTVSTAQTVNHYGHFSSDLSLKLKNLIDSGSIKKLAILTWRDLEAPDAGGSELHMHQVAQRLALAGMEVVVRTSKVKGKLSQVKRAGYIVNRKSGRYLSFPRSIAAGFARKFSSYDALIEIWNGMPFLSPLWFKKPKVVLLHHVHGIHYWKNVFPGGLAHLGALFEEKVAPLIYKNTHVVVPSQSTAEEVLYRLNWPEDKLSVAYPGVEAHFRPGVKKSEIPLVVAVGRLVASKQFSLGIEIIAKLKNLVGNLDFVIIGEGPEKSKLQDQINKMGIGHWCKLVGKVSLEELIKYYQEAWVVVSFSLKEGWGMTLTEAAACRTPSVASKIPGHQDAVIPGLSGFLANGETEFICYLKDILLDFNLRERLSSGALLHANNLSWDSTAYSILSALLNSAEGRVIKGGIERRCSVRYPTRVQIIADGMKGCMLNVSAKGALVKLFNDSSEIQPGQVIKMCANLKDFNLELNAVVVRRAFEVGLNCLGVRFCEANDPFIFLQLG